MKTSEVFKRAKQHLAKNFTEMCNTGKEKFICIAIYTAAGHSKRVTDRDVERCRNIVESRLEGKETIESWLVTQGCVPEHNLCDRSTKDRIQAHRHAWLDMLIAEFESKGD
jgi:ribosomal protein L16/L10AE